jgi:hypothetical protein
MQVAGICLKRGKVDMDFKTVGKPCFDQLTVIDCRFSPGFGFRYPGVHAWVTRVNICFVGKHLLRFEKDLTIIYWMCSRLDSVHLIESISESPFDGVTSLCTHVFALYCSQ